MFSRTSGRLAQDRKATASKAAAMSAPAQTVHVRANYPPPEGARRRGAPTPIVTLKPGHVRPVWTGHPWVFAQAIARIEGGAVAGDEVTVVDPHGAVLGRGLYTP